MSKTTVKTDAGHGGRDSGAVFGNVREKDLTLDIDNRIAQGLIKQGISAARTRTEDTTLDPNPRARKVKASGRKYCISSHINAGGGMGAEIFVSQYNDQRLAKEVMKNLGLAGLDNRRGVKTRKLADGRDYYYMHRNTGNVTTLIVEYGFIDTKKDRDFLSMASNRQKCADAVVRAICTIEGIKYKEDKPVVTKPVSTEKVIHRVQVGAYGERANAERLVRELKSKGYEAIIKTESR